MNAPLVSLLLNPPKNYDWKWATVHPQSLKIQPQLYFDLNGIKIGTRKYFENSIKSFQIFQILMGGMSFRERLQENPNIFSSEECVPLSFYSLWFTLWSVSLHIRWMVKRWIGWLKIGTSCHGKYSVVSINSRTFSKILHSWFIYSANIFKVIFTVFNCLPVSTVISLYGLHLITAPSTVK